MDNVSIIVLDVVLGALLVLAGLFLRHYLKVAKVQMDQILSATSALDLQSSQRIYEGFKSELTDMVEGVVDALDQTYTREWKAAASDGKLTKEEIDQLQTMLLSRTRAALSTNARDFLELSLDNLDDLILELAESYLDFKRTEEKTGKAAA